MRILVSGASGMLAHDVMRAGEHAGHALIGLSHRDLDVTSRVAVERAFAEAEPDAAINCAAWTDVDGAESQRAEARSVNADGAANLARSAAATGVTLVHVSTDYVFSGVAPADPLGAPRPYVESDATGPRSVYGQTKLEGERLVLAASPRHAVVRSSWLFGVGGGNFVATMLRLAGECEAPEQQAEGIGGPAPSVHVITDQIGCPTWTGHLAPALIGLIEREVTGVVHLAGTGPVSWNGFAREIFRQAEIDCRVQDTSTTQISRSAPRPPWSALSSERDDIVPMPDWRDGLAGYLAARAGMIRT